MFILTRLILPLYDTYFHLFVSFSVYFIRNLQFLEFKSFAPLGMFILRHFILFMQLQMGLFLNFSSDTSLLVYRNATDVCILILYPATLPNSLMSSNSFLVGSLEFSIYSIISSVNSDTFTFSFPIGCLLFLFLFPD